MRNECVRPPFPETPAELLPFGAETLAVYQDLVRVRRDHPWLVEHPDWFLSVPQPPFPSYTFDGPDLSEDERVAIVL